MIIPLGIGAYKRNASFMPEVVCRNLYIEKDESGASPDGTIRVQRPGLVTSATLGTGPIRGLGRRAATNTQMAVSGGRLFAGGANVGAINGSGVVAMVDTRFYHAVLGNSLYLYNGTTLVTVVMPNDAPPIVDIEQLNNYLLILTQTGRFYWLEPGETVVDPLNFATAESSSDRGVAIRRVGDEFWIAGSETIEPWQPTGDPDAPFQRVVGRIYERGCKSRNSMRRFDNTIMWVGDDNEVYRGGAVPQVVSNPGIAERIRLGTGNPVAWTFGLDGHEFYVLDVPGQGTYAYDASTTAWCEFSSGLTAGWRAHVGYQEGGDLFAGAKDAATIWRLSPESATDDGAPFLRAVTASVPLATKPPRNDSASIGIGASADCTVRMRWKDGQDEYPDYYEALSVRAPIDVATIYRLGMPDQPYRTFEVSVIDPVRVRISGMVANQSWR